MAVRSVLCLHVFTTVFLCAALLAKCGEARSRDVKASTESIVRRLLKDRTAHPAKYIRPAEKVNVTLRMTLVDILNVRLKRNEVEIIAWLTMNWDDPSLAFKVEPHQGRTVNLPSALVWTPDIVPYSTSSPAEDLFPTDVVVNPEGDVHWTYAQRMTLLCDVTDYRTDVTCSMKIGSWVQSGDQIDVQSPDNSIDLTSYAKSAKFEVLSTNATRQENFYPCCTESYPAITFSFTFRKT